MISNIDDERLSFLIKMHGKVRDEIQMRIGQRDTFAIQFIVSSGAVITLGFLGFTYAPLLFFLLPVVTLFYSIQILYSYTIHDRCHRFLIEEIEPEIAGLLVFNKNDQNRFMWESYCEIDSKQKAIKTPGIRKSFFEKITFVTSIIACILFYLVSVSKTLFPWDVSLLISVLAFGFFIYLDMYLFLHKNNHLNSSLLEELGKRDYFDKNLKTPKKGERKKKVIFLDRDGTIHLDKVNTHKIDDLTYFKDTFSSLKKLTELGYLLVIISNQDGIRKGLYDEKEMHHFNQQIIADLNEKGIIISAIYYSPYEKADNHYSFKPNPGMLLRAKYELNISMGDSYFIGDQVSDVMAAKGAKTNPMMVSTGIYKLPYKDDPNYQEITPKTFKNLHECVKAIENEIKINQ